MIVMKFGGTSVGSGQRMLEVAGIVASERQNQPVVIVSAISQVTNLLTELAGGADPKKATQDIAKLKDLHLKAAAQLNLPATDQTQLNQLISTKIDQLTSVIDSTQALGELTPRAHDLILSYGERLSIHLVAAALQSQGIPAQALEASQLMVTDSNFGAAAPLLADSAKKMKPIIKKIVDQNIVPVITGYVGADKQGVITTLGRGGSDYSATIFGYCLDAKAVWIWTDVEGVMTADPRIVTGTRTVTELSYDEAAELSHFGAKVLHPRTMVPAALSNIPIYIKNTMRPEAPGTKITEARYQHPDGAKALTVLNHLSLITVQGKGMQGVLGVAARLFQTLAEQKINVMFISQASAENNISIVIEEQDGPSAVKAVTAAFSSELKSKSLEMISLDKDLSIIAVIGEGMRSHIGVAGRVFSALGHAKISVRAIAQGSSERNLSFVVNESQSSLAMQSIHDALHLAGSKQ